LYDASVAAQMAELAEMIRFGNRSVRRADQVKISRRVKASRPACPRTKVGCWLRAVVLGQTAEIEALGRQLNDGQPGWNPDEPAVVEAACELPMRKVFGTDYDRRDVAEFAATLSEIPLPPGSVMPSHLEIEAVIRAALGDIYAIIDDIRPSVLLATRDRLILVAWHKQEWSETDVDQLISSAEAAAFERGRRPPLAS
jgi:hypothetical protein